MKENSFFIQRLIFKKSGDKKTSQFTDDKGRTINVVTTFPLISGLQYSCKLNSIPEKEPEITYKIIKYRLVISDIYINYDTYRNVVPALQYDPSIDSNYEGLINELKMYFINKTFQLKNRKTIDSFIEDYEF